jgi:quercetin dioxygenase-like cupin family protein
VLFSALALAGAKAQTPALASKFYPYDELPVRSNGPNRSRRILNGELHTGFAFEMHETELAPGEAPHPPHHHVHEEVILIHEGTVEVMIAGTSARMGPGSLAFMASNEEHGWRNVGTTRAKYYLIALGPDARYREQVGSTFTSPAK